MTSYTTFRVSKHNDSYKVAMSRRNDVGVTLLDRDEVEPCGHSQRKSRVGRGGQIGKRLEAMRSQHALRRLLTKYHYDLEDRNEDEAALEVGRSRSSSNTGGAKRGEEKAKEYQSHTDATDIEGGNPWETLVIGGDLGENLSFIEEKDREILQQRYILEHHEKNSPDQVDHHKRLLDELIKERAEMGDDEDNYLPR